MIRLIVVGAVLASGCGAEWFGAPAAARAPVRYTAAQLVGPPIDLNGPVTMAQLEDLAVQRRGTVGSIAARDLRWEVAKRYAKYVEETEDEHGTQATRDDIARIDDLVQGRLRQGIASTVDATWVSLWVAQLQVSLAEYDVEQREEVAELNRCDLRRLADASLGPPATTGLARITMTHEEMLAAAMSLQAADARPVVVAILDVRLATLARVTEALRQIEQAELPRAAMFLQQETAAYEGGQAGLAEVDRAVREIQWARQRHAYVLSWQFLAVADVERIVGHTVPVAPIEPAATSAGSGLGGPVTTAP